MDAEGLFCGPRSHDPEDDSGVSHNEGAATTQHLSNGIQIVFVLSGIVLADRILAPSPKMNSPHNQNVIFYRKKYPRYQVIYGESLRLTVPVRAPLSPHSSGEHSCSSDGRNPGTIVHRMHARRNRFDRYRARRSSFAQDRYIAAERERIPLRRYAPRNVFCPAPLPARPYATFFPRPEGRSRRAILQRGGPRESQPLQAGPVSKLNEPRPAGDFRRRKRCKQTLYDTLNSSCVSNIWSTRVLRTGRILG